LDDGYLLQLDRERVEGVWAPTARGAWILHRATLGQPLDHFVLFSSVSSWVGSVGQGNYAAANAFLDGLAQYRRARGLPALTINWGAIADVGYIARHPDVGRLLDRQGVLGLKPREATALLRVLIERNPAEAGAMRLDLRSLAGAQSHGATYRRFSHLFQQLPSGGDASDAGGAARGEMLERLRNLPAEEQQQKLEAMLRKEVAAVLGIPASRLDPQQELRQFGFDSLMSVELEAALEAELGVDLPMGFLLGESITIRAVSQRLVEQIRVMSGDAANSASSAAPDHAAPAPAPVDTRDSLVAPEA
jgi:acyl carrier protein